VASVTNDAPAAFPIGVTTVTWTVTDNSGNTATCTQNVTVTDNVNPYDQLPGRRGRHHQLRLHRHRRGLGYAGGQ
jgi:hypothetical protein